MCKQQGKQGIAGNVIFDEPNEDLLIEMNEWADRGKARRDGDMFWFDVAGPLPLWDKDDPGSGPLYLLYGDGEGGTMYAPGAPDVNEMERRIYRDVMSGGFVIDDHWETDDAASPMWRILEVGPNGQHGSRSLGEFLARDGFGALSAYSRSQGFAGYTRADSPEEERRINDAGESIPAAYSEAHGAWCGVFTNYEIGAYEVRHLVATFDVTGMTQRQVDNLSGYVTAQAEESNDDDDDDERYSGVPVEITVEPDFPKVEEPRTILVHLNIELPADAPATADDVEREIRGALEVGTSDETPALQIGTVHFPLSEEV